MCRAATIERVFVFACAVNEDADKWCEGYCVLQAVVTKAPPVVEYRMWVVNNVVDVDRVVLTAREY